MTQRRKNKINPETTLDKTQDVDAWLYLNSIHGWYQNVLLMDWV